MIPEDLQYTKDHEWVRTRGRHACGSASPTTRRTPSATSSSSPCPRPGPRCTAGETCGEVESTKSVSDIYAPVTGTVVERNDALDAAPELVNSDPYGDGWMLAIRPRRRRRRRRRHRLLDAAAYQASLGS